MYIPGTIPNWFDPTSTNWQLVQEVPLKGYLEVASQFRWPRWMRPDADPKAMAHAVQLDCVVCSGVGQLAHGVECRSCRGTGTRMGVPRIRVQGDLAAAQAFLTQFAKGTATIELLFRDGFEPARPGTEGCAVRFGAMWTREGYRPAGRETLKDGVLIADSAVGAYVASDGPTVSGVVRRIEAASPAVLAKKGPVLVDRVWAISGQDGEISLVPADERGAKIAAQLGTAVEGMANRLARSAAQAAGFLFETSKPAPSRTARKRAKKAVEAATESES